MRWTEGQISMRWPRGREKVTEGDFWGITETTAFRCQKCRVVAFRY